VIGTGDRARVDGAGLAYEVRGEGEPVVLIHAGVCADWFRALPDEPALAGHRLVPYHRAGYGESDPLEGPLGIGRQAAQCHGLMRRLGIRRAHVVGHSSSAAIALQLALDHPGAVHSLALLETALLVVPSGPFAGEAVRAYRAGDAATAVDVWLRGVCGPGYRSTLDRALPGAFEQAVSDAGTFFGQELPAIREWPFDAAAAARVTQSVSHNSPPTAGHPAGHSDAPRRAAHRLRLWATRPARRSTTPGGSSPRRGVMRHALSPRSSSSAGAAGRSAPPSPSVTPCCAAGSPGRSRSSSLRRPISCTWRTRPAWRKPSPGSSTGTPCPAGSRPATHGTGGKPPGAGRCGA
jgi:pimeloyl-ACP methyl ester carboxylesterase